MAWLPMRSSGLLLRPIRQHTDEPGRQADIHLAPRPGTNVAVLNGLLHLLIKAGHIDRDFIDQHTIGFERLAEVVRTYRPERVHEITGIPQARLRKFLPVI